MSLRQLANKKAALTRHYGADDERTLEAAGRLRTALLAQAITDAMAAPPPLTKAEIVELTALLAQAGT